MQLRSQASGNRWLFLLLAAVAISPAKWTKGQTTASDGTFAIYSSHAQLPQYQRDEQWEAFYQRGELADILVSDADIEAYDWDNQAIVLTGSASGRMDGKIGNFIVVLGGKRLYGGRKLDRISQMAVRYPVLYLETAESRTVLLVRPFHDISGGPRPQNPLWATIATPELMDHFQHLGKLRRPWSEPPFVRLLSSFPRIDGLRATATPLAVEAEYQLESERQGGCGLLEELSLVTEHNVEYRLGPADKSTVPVDTPTTSRKAVFSYDKIGRRYSFQDARNKAVWHATVVTWPVLSEPELASLDLVQRINLDLLRGYLEESPHPQERSPAEPWPLVRDTKVVELPVDWTQIDAAIKK
jgi:hypothetical protein